MTREEMLIRQEMLDKGQELLDELTKEELRELNYMIFLEDLNRGRKALEVNKIGSTH